MSRNCSRVLLLCVFSLLLSTTSWAQQPQWPLTGPAFSASPADIAAAAAKIPAEPFMEATVFFERDAYTFDAAGRETYRHTMIYRVETEAGASDWAELWMRWSPWHQQQPEIHARVIGADGKVSLLDQKTITDGPARANEDDTYTDDRMRKAPLPGMAAGAIVEEEETRTDTAPFFDGGGTYFNGFGRNVPSMHAELQVDLPASINFRYKQLGMDQAQVSNNVQDGVRHFSLVQGYLPGLTDSDINLSTHEIRGPYVWFSTGDSWGAVAAGYRKLAEPSIDPDKVKGLVPLTGADRNARIAQLVMWLHKQVRYTGVELGHASLQPATPTQVLARHYGDCKDKAALLVSLLRNAGIPAYIALLDSGPGSDVDPDLPGMNMFDHAIVYVPAGKDGDALWIDATAEFFAVGTLPYMDAGRMALVIREGTTTLTRTPDPTPAGDALVELRDVHMADFGPAAVTETSLTTGGVDASYRSSYGDPLTRSAREDLEKYAKDEYHAKQLTAVEHADAHDLTVPFKLTLRMKDAKRGDTSIDDAALWIPYGGVFSRLPRWFRTDPGTEGVKLTPQQEENQKRARAARAATYDVQPFSTEWRYTVSVPEGFTLRALPNDKTTHMGPAVLTQHYAIDAQGAVTATLRFETSKPFYTRDEVLALRDAVLAIYKEDAIGLWFDQTGTKLITQGKIREGLASDRALIGLHPAAGLYHARLSYAYLTAGLGDMARAEAQRATELDPQSAVGFRALGWICQFNQIGVQYADGFDWNCAVSALKKAAALDPDDENTAANLAILNEYDDAGERYGAHARLADAVALYRALKQKDKDFAEQYDDNMLFDLLYSGQYQQLLGELEKLPSTTIRRALGISATVAAAGGSKGIAAGLERANQVTGGAEERSNALASAGEQLIRMRLYPEAVGILSAAAEGQQDSAATLQRIATIRQLTPWNDQFLPASDPRGVVQRMYLAYFTGQLNDKTASGLLSRHAYSSDEAWERNIKAAEPSRGMLHVMAADAGASAAVMLDTIAGNLKLSALGDDSSGYRITVNSIGANTSRFFVTRENGAYLVVTDGDTPSEAGNQALYLIQAGRLREAQSLLNWMRERMHRGGGDDPLSGPLFPRFWSVDDPANPAAMKLAAGALVEDDPAIKPLLPEIRDAWQKAATDDARLNLALLLASGYGTAEDGAHMREIAATILKQYPSSNTAIGLMGTAYGLLGQWDDWKQMLDAQLARRPDDEDLIRLKVTWAETHADWPAARAILQTLIDKGSAKDGDYNDYAWTSLFDNTVNETAMKAARQATMLTHNNSFAELHTLACLYAAAGKTSEARDLLLKAMSADNLSNPNQAIWYGFGLIYEQYGITDAAIRAYSKVDKPQGRIPPTSTYTLAQARLKALQATARN